MIEYEIDPDGIATITWNMPDRLMNVLAPDARLAFIDCADRAIQSSDVRGIVLASAKDEFVVGADLTYIRDLRALPPEIVMEKMSPFRDCLRRLETSKKPVVAAMNGTALGGGLELCLACHHRIASDRTDARFGLPEVTWGFLPGAGGTQRLPRMIGVAKALPLMLDGTRMSPHEALEVGIVDALVPQSDLLAEAKAWILRQDGASQPWDRLGFLVPGGGPSSPEIHRYFMAKGAQVQAQTRDLFPGPRAILSAVFEGIRLPMDQGLAVEFSYFVSLVRSEMAQNILRTMFFGVNEARKLAARPKGVETFRVTRLGVLGAGLMGAGIAEIASLAGLEVALHDRTLDESRSGRERIASSLSKQVEKGWIGRDRAQAALARIVPAERLEKLAGCEAVIEAVFEERAVKAEITARTLAVAGPQVLFATNTSKIPISTLAEASPRPDRFIGLHFFSPVPRMPLLEIIRGRATSDETVAHALDLAKILRKTPIVVGDGPGFFTSRCVSSYMNEGIILLTQGVSPVLIENCGKQAGMPVGPLTLADEIGLDTMYRVRLQERADFGANRKSGPEFAVLEHLVTVLDRKGRKGGAGFHEYPARGAKQLWPGLGDLYSSGNRNEVNAADIRRMLLHIQALEAARCFDAGVIDSARDADIGSVLGWGFAKHTGGVVSYIDTIGVGRFVDECDAYAARFGARYDVPAALRRMAESSGTFHDAA